MSKGIDLRLSRVNRFFDRLVGAKELAGAVALIERDGKLRHFEAYGWMDSEESMPMRNDALFPIASMTKVFTSLAVLMLYEEGHFLLCDPIEEYLPEFKGIKVFAGADSTATMEAKTKPTIRDFLNHTSGMVYTIGDTPSDKLYLEAGFRTWNKSLKDFVAAAASIPLAFQPGERWVYSYSYDVLGYFVEIVSGMPLDAFCEKRIFAPLGLKNTYFTVPREKAGQLPSSYLYQNGKLELDDSQKNSVYLHTPSALSGGGGWWSSHGGIVTTAGDFLIVAKLLLNFGKHEGSRLLGRKTVELMTGNHAGKMAGKGKGYGLGVGIITSPEDFGEVSSPEEIYWAGAPYNPYFHVDYRENLIGILLTNTGPFSHRSMMDRFRLLSTLSAEE